MSAQHVEHAAWCSDHQSAIDQINLTDVTEICRAHVTRGAFTVDIEDAPAWADDEHHGGPIVLPDVIEVTAAGARDLAAALNEAARIVAEES